MVWDFLYKNAGTIAIGCLAVSCIVVVCFFTCGIPIVAAGIVGGVFLVTGVGFGGIYLGREEANHQHRHAAQVAAEELRSEATEMHVIAREAAAANPQPALAELAVLTANVRNLQASNDSLTARINARDALDDAERINVQRQIEELRSLQLQRHGLYRRVSENDENINTPAPRGRGRGNNL